MKIAVIGCGKQGRRHLAALAALPSVSRLVAADLDPAPCGAAADAVGASAAGSVEAVFADRGIDAVVIATPTAAHLALAGCAVAAHKHFLCEKPFGADAAAARAIAAAAARGGLVGRVGYLYRFAPAIAAARRAARSLPAVDAARFAIAAPGSHALWKHRRDTGGGAVNELVSHMADLALWFFGAMRDCAVEEKVRLRKRRTVAGVTAAVDAEDRIAARLTSEDGVVVMLAADFAAPRFAQSIEIRGGDAAIRASIEGSPDLYRRQAESFLGAIAGRPGRGACDLAAAARTAALLEALHAAPIARRVAPAA